MTRGKLFVVSGPSGAGKGTICKEVLDEEKNMKLSVSMTTRKPREGEENRVHYHFVTRDSFEALIEADGFMEYADVYGNLYGTPKEQVLRWMEEGSDVLLEIDVQGALQIKKSYPEGVFIFILPPSVEELRSRIEGRGSETEEAMNRRLGEAVREISLIGEYDYGVVNEDVGTAVKEVKSIIAAERCRMDGEKVRDTINRYKEG